MHKGLEEVLAIEKHWDKENATKANKALSRMPKDVRKQLKPIARKIKFMFGETKPQVIIELKLMQSVSKSALTLREINNAVNTLGQEYNESGKDYEFMISEVMEIADKAQEGKEIRFKNSQKPQEK